MQKIRASQHQKIEIAGIFRNLFFYMFTDANCLFNEKISGLKLR